MGFNPRYGNWTPAQWRATAPTVGDLIRLGWPVHAACLSCQLELDVNLERIARLRGPDLVLWGRGAPCRRRRCGGRMLFIVQPPKAQGPVPML